MGTAAAAQNNETLTRLVGRLYAIWTLDCLVEIGHAVSIDFPNRPQLYLGDDIPDVIVDLRMTYGMDPRFPDSAQRLALMTPVFGKSDGSAPNGGGQPSPFHAARKKLIDACIAFSERAVDTGLAMLTDRIRSALVPLRSHFEALAQGPALPGKALRLAAVRQMGPASETVVSILRSAGIARVFSVTSPDARWPFESTDPNGAKLVETAGATLPLPPDSKLGYTKFILLQRVAQEGEQALQLVLGPDPASDSALETLISRVYTWGTSLRDFQQQS